MKNSFYGRTNFRFNIICKIKMGTKRTRKGLLVWVREIVAPNGRTKENIPHRSCQPFGEKNQTHPIKGRLFDLLKQFEYSLRLTGKVGRQPFMPGNYYYIV